MEIQKLKTGMMQVVNLKWIFLSLFVFTAYPVISQEIIPTNNMGGYTINYTPQNNISENKSIKILGIVYDIESSELIQSSEIRFLCKKVKTNKKGEYQFFVNKNKFKKNQLIAKAIGYKTIKTTFFKIKDSDIQINFYLEEKDMPFINCN